MSNFKKLKGKYELIIIGARPSAIANQPSRDCSGNPFALGKDCNKKRGAKA